MMKVTVVLKQTTHNAMLAGQHQRTKHRKHGSTL